MYDKKHCSNIENDVFRVLILLLIFGASMWPGFLGTTPKIRMLPRFGKRTRKSRKIVKSDLSAKQKYTSGHQAAVG
jgi:hypothetical protein